MRANLIGFIGGLVLFLVSLTLLPFLRLPSLGRWEIMIGGLVFLGMLVAVGYLTRGWWAPGLIAAGGLLEIASGLLMNAAVAQGVPLLILLTYALGVLGFILWIVGSVLMAIGAMRQWREWRRNARGTSSGTGT